MKSKADRFLRYQEQILNQLDHMSKTLEKMCALMVSDQILQESVSPEGEARSANECATIVKESFSAALCLSENLEEDLKAFDYSKSEFFVDEEDDSDEENGGEPIRISSVF